MNVDNMLHDVRAVLDKHKVLIGFSVTTLVGILGLKRYFAGGVCRSKAKLTNKTVLITGGNTGIGKETALDLAQRGARVLLACRDITKAERAAEDIRRRSGNKNVHVYVLDLASLKSVRQCANQILAKEDRLDILINNAGVMWCPKWLSEEGYEMHFAVNHLGHFLLTNLLLDRIKKSAPGRIINVSSLAHTRGQIDFEDLNSDNDYRTNKAYAQSKLANVLFTRELSNRLQGTSVTVNSVHPGVVMTELGRHMHLHMSFAWLKRLAIAPIALLLIKSSTQGAQTSIHCAVEESLDGVTGKYFSDCAVKTEAPQAQDEEAARKLWTVSEKLVGLDTQS